MSSNWRLEAISNAALKRKRTSFVLRAGENKVGKKKDCLLKVPSLLCSRSHCSIFLDDDKVFIDDTSRNGTYITFSGDIGTKQFLNTSTEQPLENNDIISFGFNTASVYDINDKNAFIYRLVKESIECIDLMLSDDEEGSDGDVEKEQKERPAAIPVAVVQAPPQPPAQSSSSDQQAAPPQGKIISIEDKVINIGSDSDSEYSGDECLQNIEEMDDESSSVSSVVSSYDSENNSSSNLSVDSEDDDYDESDDDEANFVVTKSVFKCEAPTETISLDTDESDNEDHDTDAAAAPKTTAPAAPPNDTESNDEDKVLEATATTSKDKEPEKTNGDVAVTSTSEITPTATKEVPAAPEEEASVSIVADQDQSQVQNDKNDSDEAPSKSDEASDKPKTPNAEEQRNILAKKLANVKQRIAVNLPRMANLTKAQPLRKRRRTLTESEYQLHKMRKQKRLSSDEMARVRKEKLADVAQRQAEAKASATAASADANERIPFVPKVKVVSVSRGEQLCTDMLALDSSNS